MLLLLLISAAAAFVSRRLCCCSYSILWTMLLVMLVTGMDVHDQALRSLRILHMELSARNTILLY